MHISPSLVIFPSYSSVNGHAQMLTHIHKHAGTYVTATALSVSRVSGQPLRLEEQRAAMVTRSKVKCQRVTALSHEVKYN